LDFNFHDILFSTNSSSKCNAEQMDLSPKCMLHYDANICTYTEMVVSQDCTDNSRNKNGKRQSLCLDTNKPSVSTKCRYNLLIRRSSKGALLHGVSQYRCKFHVIVCTLTSAKLREAITRKRLWFQETGANYVRKDSRSIKITVSYEVC
jgi:hypothetical protein